MEGDDDSSLPPQYEEDPFEELDDYEELVEPEPIEWEPIEEDEVDEVEYGGHWSSLPVPDSEYYEEYHYGEDLDNDEEPEEPFIEE